MKKTTFEDTIKILKKMDPEDGVCVVASKTSGDRKIYSSSVHSVLGDSTNGEIIVGCAGMLVHLANRSKMDIGDFTGMVMTCVENQLKTKLVPKEK